MKITIDGKEIEARQGQSVLDAALGGSLSPICAATRTWKQREDAACVPWK